MQVVDAIAHAMKAEGIDVLFAYPVNPLIEAAAKLDIRTVIVRQERIGLQDRRILYATRPWRRERLRWRCPSLLRIGAYLGHSSRLSTTFGTLLPKL